MIDVIFNSFLYQKSIDVINNKELEQFCRDRISLNNNNQHLIFDGDWEFMKPEVQNILRPLFDQIYMVANDLHRQLGFKQNFHQVIKNSWANLNDPDRTSQIHRHGGYFFSGVYYVAGDASCGQLEFINPVAEHNYVIEKEWIDHHNGFNAAYWTVNPEVGKLVLFPSWMLHSVKPNKGDTDRISIAFNTRILPT